MTNYFILFLSSVLAATGQLFLKLGANAQGWAMLSSAKLWVGLFCYFLGAALWVYALSKVALNVAYPFTVITFVLVFLLSSFFLGETINKLGVLGMCLICTGFLVMFYSSVR